MTPVAPSRFAGRVLLRTQSDERLIELLRAGNQTAFEAIVSRYRAPILRYCARRLPLERAEDAVQHTFTRAYESLRRPTAELQLRPWLYTVAHNACIDVLRDRSRQHAELDPGTDGVDQPHDILERRERLRGAIIAVQGLPPRQRDALVLREMEGHTYAQIAAELGVTDAGVRQLLVRARTTLRARATAITPFGLVTRLSSPTGAAGPHASESVAARVAELCAGAGGGVVIKTGLAVLVTGTVIGGVAVAPRLTAPGESGDGQGTAMSLRAESGVAPAFRMAAHPNSGALRVSPHELRPAGKGGRQVSSPLAVKPPATTPLAPRPHKQLEADAAPVSEIHHHPKAGGAPCGSNGVPAESSGGGECAHLVPSDGGPAAPGTEGTPADPGPDPSAGSQPPADSSPAAAPEETPRAGSEGVPVVLGP